MSSMNIVINLPWGGAKSFPILKSHSISMFDWKFTTKQFQEKFWDFMQMAHGRLQQVDRTRCDAPPTVATAGDKDGGMEATRAHLLQFLGRGLFKVVVGFPWARL